MKENSNNLGYPNPMLRFTEEMNTLNRNETQLQKIEGKIIAADIETNKVTIVINVDPSGIRIGDKVWVIL